MAQGEPNIQGTDPEIFVQGVFVPITEEIRKLANGIANAVDNAIPGKLDLTMRRKSVEIRLMAEFKKTLILIQTFEELRGVALQQLAVLGKLKNENFPSSARDHFYRRSEFDRILHLRTTHNPSFSDQTITFWHEEKFDFAGEANRERMIETFGADPLELPEMLLGRNDLPSNIFIFMEHYVPEPLIEVAKDVADRNREFCPVSSKAMTLLTQFIRCYQSFPVIRTKFILHGGDTRSLDHVHERLLQFVQLIHDTALVTVPNKIGKVETSKSLLLLEEKTISIAPRSSKKMEMSSSVTIADTQQTEYSVPENKSLGETPLLNIKIQRHPLEHFQFIATDGEIHSHQTSQKRTLIVIALLLKSKRAITRESFCQLYYGKAVDNPSARFHEPLKKAGLHQYKSKTKPYTFPGVTFDCTDISDDELNHFCKRR